MTQQHRAPRRRILGVKVLAWPARANEEKNPYQKLLYQAMENEDKSINIDEFSLPAAISNKYDILHLHWPDVYLARSSVMGLIAKTLALRGLLAFMRFRGTAVVWTAHNFKRHRQRNGSLMSLMFWPWFLRRVDGLIFLTKASEAEALGACPCLSVKPRTVTPHGHYRSVLGPGVARTSMALPVILFFGTITDYKQVTMLVRAFGGMPGQQAVLRIVGRMSASAPDRLLAATLDELPPTVRACVQFEERFLDDGELCREVRAATLVVLPYVSVFNSGSAIYALSCDTPILASDIPLFRELQGLVDGEWVRLFEPPLTARELMAALAAARRLKAEGASPSLDVLDWARVGRATLAFYERVIVTARHA